VTSRPQHINEARGRKLIQKKTFQNLPNFFADYSDIMSTPLFRWSGEYVGFVSGTGHIFDAQSTYLGWIEDDGRVWRKDGRHVGQMVENNYILKKTIAIAPIPRIPRIPPIPPIPPIPSINRIGKIGKIGWQDAFDDLLSA